MTWTGTIPFSAASIFKLGLMDTMVSGEECKE